MSSVTGKLVLIPTPIGNMGDMTARAIETLKQVTIVACEDTRHSGQLLARFGITGKRLISYHNFNEEKRSRELLTFLAQGEQIGVVTDAGTPGISDPAYRVVRSALDARFPVEALPGASALLPALVASGLPTDRFFFEGFLPVKSGARKNRIATLAAFPHTLVFYESPHRIHKALDDLSAVLGERPAALAREISKIHEEYVRGTLGEIRATLPERVRGELVLVVAGKENE